ncbi:hypothetical protein [Pseudobacteriovorax antillogorgiicola]|uniref:Alkylhydroperoxidase family enzyme, contains CxxC motif n=1 Tax=Pseudobacteriovorax antillogorgiicola TaxID=1513793 RepID=A0A1Y6CQH0_9BACT|nr:hypothetical protein [Pseudobacteriovorax antillogorgiicola]TCS41565.1 alkylhydroperoxidase family enzyme [Pseudobacteriovorax antillogorgiicola]SMF83363.1 Alkylhydroperoxidase family enzyme, contains CxxC motif [Pseudobacteriovorax antillogorgiicola]
MKAFLRFSIVTTGLILVHFASHAARAQTIPKPPPADVKLPYYDRHRIDVSNLRDFYDGLLTADLMIHADGMFDAATKWKITLYQMVKMGSRHHQARAARQLSLMGVSLKEIKAVWSKDYPESIIDTRLRTAFELVDQAIVTPSKVTADTHAALRMRYIDRQIAELFELVAVNVAVAKHDLILPIPTDKKTVDWAKENLASVGWSPGRNAPSNAKEQRQALFVGDALKKAKAELMADWEPEDLNAPNPQFKTDWVNYLTGYNISKVTLDGDRDGIENPFDFYPEDYLRWKGPEADKANMPPKGTPAFNVKAYDYKYFRPAKVAKTKYPPSDRQRFDTEWTRRSSLGTIAMDQFFSGSDRALDISTKWELFLVFQLASGCVHCQAHGAFGVFDAVEDDYPYDQLPSKAVPKLIKRIQALVDFERSSLFTEAEKAAFRFARDSGSLPPRVTAAHVEHLRRHYSDREIQELMASMICYSWLATVMQAQMTVTDQLSMSFTLRTLGPLGWKPGVHLGLPSEQRPYHMTELGDQWFAKMSVGGTFDISSEWVGYEVPLAVDSDLDGVDDAFDGFPRDRSKWADTDRDGIEDRKDDDIDGDGITNKEEIASGTFPYKADSDADGVTDTDELRAGTNPIDPYD